MFKKFKVLVKNQNERKIKKLIMVLSLLTQSSMSSAGEWHS